MELNELIMLSAASLARPSENRDWITGDDLREAVLIAHELWREVLEKDREDTILGE